jgi:hypothetical protein
MRPLRAGTAAQNCGTGKQKTGYRIDCKCSSLLFAECVMQSRHLNPNCPHSLTRRRRGVMTRKGSKAGEAQEQGPNVGQGL